MTSIYLFRHAHTDFPKELIGGRSNEVPITEKGRAQAHNLGLWIASRNLEPDFIAVSPAVRTLDTARIAMEAANISKPVQIEDRLQELTKGDAEGQPRAVVDTPDLLARMASEMHYFKFTNGESNDEAATRIDGWISEIVKDRPGQLVFGFTHGIVTRCLIGRYLGWSFEEFNRQVIDNTAATVLSFDGSELSSIDFNIGTGDLLGLEPK